MSKLAVSEFVTIDGVFEDPGGGEGVEYGGWAFKFDRGPEGDEFKFDELMAAGAMLLGRVTYEGFARAWPAMDANEFGKKMNSMPKFVFSSTLENPEWNNSRVIRGDLGERVAEIKQQVEGDILVAGSGQLVRGLADLALVDEYRLMVFPTALGAGKRLFDGVAASIELRLQDARPAGETTILTYVPR